MDPEYWGKFALHIDDVCPRVDSLLQEIETLSLREQQHAKSLKARLLAFVRPLELLRSDLQYYFTDAAPKIEAEGDLRKKLAEASRKAQESEQMKIRLASESKRVQDLEKSLQQLSVARHALASPSDVTSDSTGSLSTSFQGGGKDGCQHCQGDSREVPKPTEDLGVEHTLRQELRSARREITDLRQQLADTNSSVVYLTDSLRDERHRTQSLEASCNRFSHAPASMAATRAAVLTASDTMQRDQLLVELAAVRSKVVRLQADNEELMAMIRDSQRHSSHLEARVSTGDSERSALARRLHRARDESKALEQQLGAMASEKVKQRKLQRQQEEERHWMRIAAIIGSPPAPSSLPPPSQKHRYTHS